MSAHVQTDAADTATIAGQFLAPPSYSRAASGAASGSHATR